MASRLPGAGDLYGFAGGGVPSASSTNGTPLHLSYLSSSSSAAATGAVKRPISDLLEQQQQLLHPLLLRSVKPKTTHYLHTSPISPFDLLDPTPSPTFSYSFLKQHLFQQQQQQQQQRQAATTQFRSRLEELEKHLLDDSDDPPTTTAAVSSDWNDTMNSLISSSSCSSKQLLMDFASALAEGNVEDAETALAALRRGANPRSNDPEERLCVHLASALSGPTGGELCSVEHLAAAQLLNEASPCFKNALLAANLAIIESTRGVGSLHVVDFDVGHGLQYLALLNSGARPSSLEITAVADPSAPYSTNTGAGNLVKTAGERLAKAAERAGVAFKFNLVTLRPSELTRAAIGCDPDEPVAVNLAFHLHKVPDESVTPANPRDELLRRVRALQPKVVTLVEQEMNANTTPFLARLAESHAYYSALLGSLASGEGDRARLEDCLLRKAANAAARDGTDRVERCEVFGKWRARMGMAGFRPSPLGPSAADSLRRRLTNPGGAFSVREDCGGLCFGYSGRILTVASAWH